jgi:hypothetical protein
VSAIDTLSVVISAIDGTHLERAVMAAHIAAARYSHHHEIIIAATPPASAVATRLATTRPLVYATYHSQPRRAAYLLRDACSLTSNEMILAFEATAPPSTLALERLLAAYTGQDVLVGMRTPAPTHPLQRTHAALIRRILVSDQVDPLLPLALFRADLTDLLPGDGELAPPLAHLYAIARRRQYVTAQIALPAQSASAYRTGIADLAALLGHGPARGAPPALGVLAVVGSLWLLLRRRR